MRFGLLQFSCSLVFCRKKSSLLWRVPFRLLCLWQETAHPVDSLPLFIVQHMSISLGGDNRGVAHEIRTLFLTSFFLRRKRPQKYKKDFRHPKGGTGGLPFLRSYSTSKQRKKQYPKVGNSGQQHLKFCQKEI